MSTIIGLGNAGCNIAKKMSRYPQYKICYIDSEKRDESKFKLIPKQKTFEDYEKTFPSIKSFLRGTKSPYTLILGGSGTIGGGVLRLLEQLKTKDVFILYVKPDLDILSDLAGKQERLVFHVLQQYARSNMLNKIFVVANSQCEVILGNLTIKNYFEKINELITSTYHMYNVFQQIEPIIQTHTEPREICRIATFGLVDKEGVETLLYDLKFPREKYFYYSISNDTLETDTSLMKRIKEQVREKMSDKIKVSYSVYENDYDQDYIYSCSFASMIQEENYDFSLDNDTS